MSRINIPSNPGDLLSLALNILAKHTADGPGSPLAGLDMADMRGKTTTADTQHKLSEKLRRDAETATQNRDLALGGANVKGTVAWYVRSVRDVLEGLNKSNEQKLGDWGYKVDQSPRSNEPAPTGTSTTTN
jgi:hypothetical protein